MSEKAFRYYFDHLPPYQIIHPVFLERLECVFEEVSKTAQEYYDALRPYKKRGYFQSWQSVEEAVILETYRLAEELKFSGREIQEVDKWTIDFESYNRVNLAKKNNACIQIPILNLDKYMERGIIWESVYRGKSDNPFLPPLNLYHSGAVNVGFVESKQIRGVPIRGIWKDDLLVGLLISNRGNLEIRNLIFQDNKR